MHRELVHGSVGNGTVERSIRRVCGRNEEVPGTGTRQAADLGRGNGKISESLMGRKPVCPVSREVWNEWDTGGFGGHVENMVKSKDPEVVAAIAEYRKQSDAWHREVDAELGVERKPIRQISEVLGPKAEGIQKTVNGRKRENATRPLIPPRIVNVDLGAIMADVVKYNGF